MVAGAVEVVGSGVVVGAESFNARSVRRPGRLGGVLWVQGENLSRPVFYHPAVPLGYRLFHFVKKTVDLALDSFADYIHEIVASKSIFCLRTGPRMATLE